MNLNKRKGFTLIEIMIVVMIIALIAAIAVPNLVKSRKVANDAAAVSTLLAILKATEVFTTDNERLPASMDDLFDGGYINEDSIPANMEVEFGHQFAYIFWENQPDNPYTFLAIGQPNLANYTYVLSLEDGLEEWAL